MALLYRPIGFYFWPPPVAMVFFCCLLLLNLSSFSSLAIPLKDRRDNAKARWPTQWQVEGKGPAVQGQKVIQRDGCILGEPNSCLGWEELMWTPRVRLPEDVGGRTADPPWILPNLCPSWSLDAPHQCRPWVLKLGFVSALGLLVVVCNGAIIAVIASTVSGWSQSSRLVLLSLATADAALAVLVVPLNLYRSLALAPDDRAGEGEVAYCRFVAFANSTIFGASLYSLAGVSLERYVAVFFPLHYWRLLSRKRVALLIATAWLLPALILAPMAVPGPRAVLRVRFSTAALLCEPDYASNATYSLLIAGTIFCPAAGLITFANLRLWLAARAQRQREKGRPFARKGSGPKRLCLLHLDTAARILLPVVIAFYVCWAPCILTILYNAITKERVPEWVEFISLWLPTGNGFLNCFIYFWVNRNFRHKFQTIGRRLCWPCRQGRRDEQLYPLPTLSAAVEGICEGSELPPHCSSTVTSSNGRTILQEDQVNM